MNPTRPGEPLHLRYGVLVQAVRNDFCLVETCLRMAEEGVEAIYLAVPMTYWNGDQVNEADRSSLLEAYAEIKRHIRCEWQEFKVPIATSRSKLAADLETTVRNRELMWIRKEFDHVIVLDADELWMKGRMRRLDAIIAEFQPTAVSLSMIPTIGVPGLPVEGAKDLASVYFNKEKKISWCRGYEQDDRTLTLDNPRAIYHFSSTRRTMEELVEKCRRSGHYDDKAYEFDEWLATVVPNVVPGMKDVHMYRGGSQGNIWPEIRSWTAEELNDIPKTLHPYLACEVRDLPRPLHSQPGLASAVCD